MKYKITGTIRIFCVICALVFSAVFSAYGTNSAVFAASFRDITGHWAEEDILKAYAYKLFFGINENTFAPDKQTTRAEFITVMTRCLNPEITEEADPYPYWATRYIKFSKKAGYLPADYDESESHCSEAISRLEMIRLLSLIIEKLQLPHNVPLPHMTDLDDLDDADVSLIRGVLTTGVIVGDRGKVRPYGITTRAELATVLMRIYKKSPLIEDIGSNASSVTETEISGSSDSGYRIGDVFSGNAFASWRVNNYLMWKILESPDSGKFSFVIVNNNNEVVASSRQKIEPGSIRSKIEFFPYVEYNYTNNRTFWDYREWGSHVGEDRSVAVIEINPKYKKYFDLFPVSPEYISNYERVADYITNLFKHLKQGRLMKYDATLNRYAKEFSETMLKNDFFGHDNPSGISFYERVRRYEIDYRAIGENLAFRQDNPLHLVFAWINSEGHRANILADYTHSSVGIVVTRDGEILSTQLFILQE